MWTRSMLDTTDGLVTQDTTLTAAWDNRLPWLLQCIGPIAPNRGIGLAPSVWTGHVYSAGVPVQGASAAGISVVLVNGSMQYTWDRFPQEHVVTGVSVAFDVNGRLTAGHTTIDGAAYLTFYNDADGVWQLLQLPVGSRTPVVALDRFDASFGQRDVTVSYLRGGSLYIRYQRERYETEHLVTDGLRSTDMLRTAGITEQGRFTWRFERRVRWE